MGAKNSNLSGPFKPGFKTPEKADVLFDTLVKKPIN